MHEDTGQAAQSRLDWIRTILFTRAAAALAFTAATVLLAARLAIWFPPSEARYWQAIDVLRATASSWQDYALLLALITVHWLLVRNVRSLRRPANVAFAIGYVAVIVVAAFNVISIYALGSPFDFRWLTRVNPRDSAMTIAILGAILTRSMILFLVGSLIVVPACFLVVRSRLRLGTVLAICATLVVATTALTAITPAPADRFSQVYRNGNPILIIVRQMLFPTFGERRLAGESGLDPEAEALVSEADWTQRGALPPAPCCEGMNVVLITVDTVPWRAASRAHVLADPAAYPNLARLYRSGIAFDNFYTNYPGSTEALGVIVSSIYPSNLTLTTSVGEWVDRALPTLPGALAAHGYTNGMIMGGELSFDGVDTFLRGRGFSTLIDSDALHCGPNDDALMARYAQKGDACTAAAAVRWIEAAPASPFFLWTWFTNPHAPYFTSDPAMQHEPRSTRLHDQALRETDAAIGRVLAALAARRLLERTIVILHADHGESFGEHGLHYHGSALYEEQTHIPLIVSVPGMQRDTVSHTLGSLIDLAPTIANLIGVPAPAAWQGGSLFAQNRLDRAFLISLGAGRLAGYREGRRKYILSSLDAEPYYYDLARDPGEMNPQPIPDPLRRLVAARLGGFIRARNVMTWPRRQQGP